MYPVENKSDIYVYYNESLESGKLYDRYVLKKIGDENSLIVFLAEGFFLLWDTGAGDFEDRNAYRLANHRFDYSYFDGYERVISPYTYYDDALIFYREHIKTGLHPAKKKYVWKWKQRYKYSFRSGNVECIRKCRGGPYVRPRRIKAAKAAYLDPEQKLYMRGSITDYPAGWWDDWNRCNERSWKSQRKTRHQWKGS